MHEAVGRARGILLVMFFEAGLLTGLSRFWEPACALAVLGFVTCAARWLRPALLALVLGLMSGRVGRVADDARCAARLPPHTLSLTVRLHESGNARGIVEATPVAAACRGTIMLRLRHADTLSAGQVLQLEGRWLPRTGPMGRAGGILLVTSYHAGPHGGTLGERVRAVLSRRARTLYGSRAPVVEALILGRRGGLDPRLRDDFARAGLVHLLSISGFHVGLIVAWVVLVAHLTGLPRQRALWIGAASGLAYAAFLGWPAPATRAAILCALVAYQLHRQRHAALGSLIAVTVLAVTIGDPWAVVSPGAWLSVSALLGAQWAGRWCAHRVTSAPWACMIASSAGATVATAPMTATVFGMVPVSGVALNLIAIPLAALAVPGVVVSLLLAPWVPPLAGALAAGAGLLLHGLELLARLGAVLPGGCLIVPPSLSTGLLAVAVLLAGRWALGRFVTARVAGRRLALAAAAASWLPLLWHLPVGTGDGASGLTLHFLDVGQGDAAVIRTPRGHWVVIDAGPRDDRADAGRDILVPFLRRQRVRAVDVMVISHAHADHIGGATAVLEQLPVGTVLEPGELVPDPRYGEFLSVVAADAGAWHAARRGMRFVLDSVEFDVVHPDTAWIEWGLDLNEDSAILLVRYGGFSALLSGDGGLRAETRMHGRVPAVDLLKVGHHGSRTATGNAWLDELEPGVAVISVGRRNRYGHPSPEAIARLAAHRVSIFRTDHDGAVTVRTDGARYTIQAGTRHESYAVHPEERPP